MKRIALLLFLLPVTLFGQATSGSYGAVKLAPGQTSATLSTVATSGLASDLINPSASIPKAGLYADYDFHESSGPVINDISGNGNTWTMTSGVPSGSLMPPRVLGANGLGIGLAIGSDSTGNFAPNNFGLTLSSALPTSPVGTSCETLPVMPSSGGNIRSVVFQIYTPPASIPYYSSFMTQDILSSFSSTSPSAKYTYTSPTQFGSIASDGSSFYVQLGDSAVGLHTFIFTYPLTGQAHVYFDGIESGLGFYKPIPPFPATNFVLGCTNSVQNGGQGITAPFYLTHLAFYTSVLDSTQVKVTNAVLSSNATANGAKYGISPFENAANQVFVAGDSTTDGINDTPTLKPVGACLASGVNGCYGSSYNTALPNINNASWLSAWGGIPGGTAVGLSVRDRESSLYAQTSNGVHVSIVWTGINGNLNTYSGAPCNYINAASKAGYEVWVSTIYSLSTTAAGDQGGRDFYNSTILSNVKNCGAKGVLNIAEDAFMGADGTNGRSPFYANGSNVHASGNGYAYIASIWSRVLGNYYGSDPSRYTTVTSPTYSQPGNARLLAINSSSNAVNVTLPDCIGMGGSGIEYRYLVSGVNPVTLSAASISGQTELINNGSSSNIAPGAYKYSAFTLNTASAAPGGCNWQQIP